VLWTSFKTKEYPPEEYARYNNIDTENKVKMSFGQLLANTPKTMLQLAVTQFFSWFSLFLMWVYTTQGIAQSIWNTSDATSKDYNEAGNWTGVIFAAYSLFAALYSLVLPSIADKFGRKNTYMVSLIAGGLGLLSMVFIHDKYVLFISMIGVGIAWAAILAMPYAILSSSLPPTQTGVYMGIFNATITIPQIFAGLLGGIALTALGGNAINVIGLAGVSMVLAGIFAKLVIKTKD
jgi:maltose/moltooligosaccharide transporter